MGAADMQQQPDSRARPETGASAPSTARPRTCSSGPPVDGCVGAEHGSTGYLQFEPARRRMGQGISRNFDGS